jgi:L-threonylcarbamoyladenylate synthase
VDKDDVLGSTSDDLFMKIWSLEQLDEIVAALRNGAIVAYPTEAVFGLGCDPKNSDAVSRLFSLKQRSPDKGFLLIGACEEQFNEFVDWTQLSRAQQLSVRSTWPGPHTWIMPAQDSLPTNIVGVHAGVAVRVTAHGVAANLCEKFGGALISTSANLNGQKAARSLSEVTQQFENSSLYGVLDAPLGGDIAPSEIRDAISNVLVRSNSL